MINVQKHGNTIVQLEHILLASLVLIIYSNSTIIRAYLIFVFPVVLLLLTIYVLLYNKPVYISHVDKLWYIVISYLLLSLPFSYDSKESLIFVSYFVIIILIMTLLKSSTNIQQGLIKLFYRFALLYSVITIISFFVRDLIPKYFSFLFFSERLLLIRNEINRGAFSGLAGEVANNMFSISIGLGVLLNNIIVNKKRSLINLTLIIIMVASLLLTQKRSVIVVLFLLLILMTVALKNNRTAVKRGYKLILTLIIIAILLASISLDFSTVFNRFTVGQGLNLSGRDDLWDFAKGMFFNKPWFGYGIGTYNTYCNEVGYFSNAMHAHNIYVQMLSELGIVGFIILMTAFLTTLMETVKIMRNTMKLTDKSELKVASLFSLYMQLFFLLYGFSGNPLYNFTQLFVYFIAVSIGQYVKIEINDNKGLLKRGII